jgi:hypothetical protein
MQVGDLVVVKNSLGHSGDDERKRYPWKFEVGVVVDARPWGAIPGKEVSVFWPSARKRAVLTGALEVISASR